MKICPLEAEVFHANGRQNEANRCDQVKAPVPTVMRLSGPQ